MPEFWRNQRVLVIGSTPNNPFPTWKGLEQGLSHLSNLGAATMYRSIDQLPGILPELQAFAPTATLLVSTNHRKMMQVCRCLAELPKPRGLWHLDLREAPSQLRVLKGCFDTLFMCWDEESGPYALGRWRDTLDADSAYMPQGAPIYQPPPKPPRETHRAIFIGDIHDKKFHGDRGPFMRTAGVCVRNKVSRHDRQALEIASPLIYLGAKYAISHSPQVNLYTSIRLYNILSFGAMALVQRFPGIERIIRHKEHALICNDAVDARNLMSFYEHRVPDRERMKAAGRALHLAKHTSTARLMNMVHALVTGDKAFWGFLDSVAERAKLTEMTA